MDESSRKWKSRFLSSSIPLEYETAKILSNLGLSVSYDYSYFRKEGNENKEFSVDLKGLGFIPLDDENEVDACVEILVECKYREDGKKWFFLPEIAVSEVSERTSGNAVCSITSFSTKEVNKESIYAFEDQFAFSLKGTEINFHTGDVFDKDLRHGILQLKYAMPYLLSSAISNNLSWHLEDAIPHFIFPILVTNAELYLLKEEFSIERLKKCEDIEEIADKVPYLTYFSDYSPDFAEHHKRIFRNFYDDFKENESLLYFEKYQEQKKHPVYGIYDSPMRMCEELQCSYQGIIRTYYSHFIICSVSQLQVLLEDFFDSITKAVYY